MKTFKQITILLFLALVPAMASAYDFEKDGIYYNVLADGNTVEVTYDVFEKSTYKGMIAVPETVTNGDKTYTVTAIGDRAFYYSKVETVILPQTVSLIDEYAFYFCGNLTSMTIPLKVNKIGRYSLSGTAITSIAVPEGVEIIEQGAFMSCEQLHTVFLPSTLKQINSYGFYANHALTEIYCRAEKVPTATQFAVFQGIDPFDVLVPESSVSLYEATEPWSNMRIYPPEEFALSMEIKGVKKGNFDEVSLEDYHAFEVYDGEKLIDITSAATYFVPNNVDKTYKFVPTNYFVKADPIYYTVKGAGVSEVAVDKNGIIFEDNTLYISGDLLNCTVEIFDMAGAKVMETEATEVISLQGLATGVYVVKCKDAVKKISL